jgi:hypothetical protein
MTLRVSKTRRKIAMNSRAVLWAALAVALAASPETMAGG